MSDRTYYSQEAKAKAQRKNMMAVGEALLAGILLGAVGGLILGPQNGAKVRQQLKHGVDLGLNTASDEASGLGKLLSKRMKRGRKQAMSMMHDTEDTADNLLSSVLKRFA
jgi:hypothetical protein